MRPTALLDGCAPRSSGRRSIAALEAVWQVVGDANRYVDEQAPWALRKTDPARMGTVLYVWPRRCAHLAILIQPFMPRGGGKAAGPARPSRRSGAQLREPGPGCSPAGPLLPAPSGVFPRFVETARRPSRAGPACSSTAIAISISTISPASSMRWSPAPGRPGSGTLVTICTRLDGVRRVRAIAERFADVWCSVGIASRMRRPTTPMTVPHGSSSWRSIRKVVGIGETGLDYYYDHSPRERQEEVFRAAYRGRARARACRSSSIAGMPMRKPSPCCEEGAAKGGLAA